VGTIPAEFTDTASVAKEVISAMKKLASGEKPWSLMCSFHYPHAPMVCLEEFFNHYPEKEMPVSESISDTLSGHPYEKANNRLKLPQYADPEKVRGMVSVYYALIEEIDSWVGKILDALEATGQMDNTLIVFASDHGEMLGAHGLREKNIFFEESVRVPLILKLPGAAYAGKVVSSPVSLINLYSTLMDYCGVTTGTKTDAPSLRSLIEARSESEDAFVCSEWNPRGPVEPNLMIRTGQWKLFIPNSKDSAVKNVLYDVHVDSFERRNLLADDSKKYEKITKKLQSDLCEWLNQVGSPAVDSVKERNI
jgi:arylsulfatase A-like enzyme